jgi:hypothetical protein
MSGLSVASEGKAAVRLAMDSSLGEGYQALWKEAKSQVTLPPLSDSQATMGPVDVRQVSWRNVRASELPIRHGQLLLLADKLLLFWLQGDHLYLLQTTRSGAGSGG